jgi:hypothetical protein
MRVRYLRDFDFTPPTERRMTLQKWAGQEETVKRDWGAEMVARGDAEEIEPPKRPAAEPQLPSGVAQAAGRMAGDSDT